MRGDFPPPSLVAAPRPVTTFFFRSLPNTSIKIHSPEKRVNALRKSDTPVLPRCASGETRSAIAPGTLVDRPGQDPRKQQADGQSVRRTNNTKLLNLLVFLRDRLMSAPAGTRPSIRGIA